jgi:hypothetical protein
VKRLEEGLKLLDRRYTHHLGPKRSGMGKAFTIPPQMLAHAMELLMPKDFHKLLGMFEQNGKALV